MNNNEWVIDAFVLYKACDHSDASKLLLALSFLLKALKNDIIAFDYQNHILNEYLPCIKADKILQKWYKQLKDRGKMSFYDGELNEKNRKDLIDKFSFDRSDHPYVAVASKTKDKTIVTEDSDYTPNVIAYLRNNLSVSVIEINRAV